MVDTDRSAARFGPIPDSILIKQTVIDSQYYRSERAKKMCF
jgi:hypothetical protein